MNFKRTLLYILMLSSFQGYSQTKINLNRPVNNPLSHDRNPSISGDGKFMIFETDYGEEYLYPVITRQIASLWSRPEEVTGIFSKLTRDKDWNLNYDGSILYFSSSRYGGVGNSDIWMAKKSGDSWISPTNLAKPINSSSQEVSPSISADGKTLYFVRMDGKKNSNGKECGSVWMSNYKGNSWSDPVKLPYPINSGCECNVKILTDNKTLLFLSERPGGKGGFDLYKSVLSDNGKWSTPEPYSFLNTSEDDGMITIPEKGGFAIGTGTEHENDDLFKIKLPDNLKAQPHLVIHGLITEENSTKTLPAKIKLYQIQNPKNTQEFYTEGSTGKFKTVATGAQKHNLTVFPLNKGYFFETRIFDVSNTAPDQISLVPTTKGSVKPLDQIVYNHKAEIIKGNEELDNLVKILKNNPSVNIEVAVHAKTITKDSIKTEDLTEIDSVVTIKTQIIRTPGPLDSLGNPTEPTIDSVEAREVTYIYHNNRTQKEAEKIRDYLRTKGINSNRIKPVGYGDMEKKVHDPDRVRKVEIIVL